VALACSTLGVTSPSDAGICNPPKTVCCQNYTTSYCSDPSSCDAFEWWCAGSDDCSNGTICCMLVQNAAGRGGTATCLPGPTCPLAPLWAAQICKSDADCANGVRCLTASCSGVVNIRFCDGTAVDPQGSPLAACTVTYGDAAVEGDASTETGAADGGGGAD
jgi:hypothetical protein